MLLKALATLSECPGMNKTGPQTDGSGFFGCVPHGLFLAECGGVSHKVAAPDGDELAGSHVAAGDSLRPGSGATGKVILPVAELEQNRRSLGYSET